MTHTLTDGEREANKARRRAAKAREVQRATEREAETQAAAQRAEHEARFNKRSTPDSVRRSLAERALTLNEYRAAEARGLVGERSTPQLGGATGNSNHDARWEAAYIAAEPDIFHRVGKQHVVSLPPDGDDPPADPTYPDPTPCIEDRDEDNYDDVWNRVKDVDDLAPALSRILCSDQSSAWGRTLEMPKGVHKPWDIVPSLADTSRRNCR